MFFSDDEKLIYTAPTGTKYDPIALHRKLVVASGGRLNEWLATWGDRTAPEIAVATAEESLVGAARTAFACTPFNNGTGTPDRDVIDSLCDFLEWQRGKDLRVRRQRR